MKKKRKLTKATEEAFRVVNENPLLYFITNVIEEVSDIAKEQMMNDYDITQQSEKIKELMSRIQSQFENINKDLDNLEKINEKIETNIAEMDLIINPKSTRH